MKRLISLVFLPLLIFSSCTSVKFEEPQPENITSLSEFPSHLQGTYLDSERDTIRIEPYSLQYGNPESLFTFSGNLTSGDMHLREWEELYILNIKDGQAWQILIFEPRNGDISVKYLQLKKKEQQIINQIEEVLPVERIRTTEGKVEHYIIAPTFENFQFLLQENLFTEVTVLNRIN